MQYGNITQFKGTRIKAPCDDVLGFYKDRLTRLALSKLDVGYACVLVTLARNYYCKAGWRGF